MKPQAKRRRHLTGLIKQSWLESGCVYGYIYPFVEGGAGVMMIIGGLAGLIAAPFALFVGTIGAWSVYKAVYIDKRDIKCACVGGGSNVPLGFISLSENLGMMGMALWMVAKYVIGM